MLSYQHGYHAGAFADVIKHLALTRLLNALIQKDKPLFYLETHAGKGFYDLFDAQASKTLEYKQGIELLWSNKGNLPYVFTDYLALIEKINKHKVLRFYPGSPYFAINQLRKQDRLYLCELHPKEYESLTKIPRFYKKVFINNADGLLSLKALLPPHEKRGLIFMDPSYEIKEDYKLIPAMIKQAFSRFSNGVFCLWYPIINARFREQLIRGMDAIGAKNNLRTEFNLGTSTEGMKGCGLWVINPPYPFSDEMQVAMKYFKTCFNPQTSSWTLG